MRNKGALSMPGIDKSIIKPTILSFDYEKLSKVYNKVLDITGITLPIIDRTTGECVEISNMVINDGYVFKDLKTGVNMTGNKLIRYNKLDLSRMGMDDNNLVPYNMAAYRLHVENTTKYIYDSYGIELDVNDLKGEVLELNTNIILDRPYKEYSHLLRTIAKVCKGGKHRFKYQLTSDDDDEVTIDNYEGNVATVTLFNKNNISLKIYNKSRQLAEVKHQNINQEIMRIELTLKRQEAIENVLGTCYINDLTDEKINEVFLEFVKVNVFDKLDKYIEDVNKELYKILKEEKKKDAKRWKRNFLLRGGYKAFDIQQMLDIIKVENPKNYSRDAKKLQSDIEELEVLHDNLMKLREIKNKLFI